MRIPVSMQQSQSGSTQVALMLTPTRAGTIVTPLKWRIVEHELAKRGLLDKFNDVVVSLREGADTGAPSKLDSTFLVRVTLV